MDSYFVPPTSSVYESEVAKFYANLCYTDDHTLVLLVHGTDFELDEFKLGEILEVPTDRMKTVSGKASEAFINGSATGARLFKKELKPEYQLLFALVNKVLLPRNKVCYVASIADLVLFETLSTFKPISRPVLMIEHIIKVVNTREGIHDVPYGFLLTKAQELSNAEIQLLKDENGLLRVQLAEKAQEPCSRGVVEVVNTENGKLRAENEKLRKKIDGLCDQIL
ncbi:hypothetical protein RND71_018089 [Anisodus tanguticus]|uniref:Uncharacterized protein n=1 Tax=Anisodus tanguticus TaxID=243964 RepID=A0AAE1S3I3_9SOLA|nr:hypothetical protein RND71_018089 [Anisodus tanguticus]